MSAPGIISLVEKGIVNGSRKVLHKDKTVFSGLMGSTPDEVAFAHLNPLVELWDADHILNIRNIASNPNQVAINNAISIDLTGQINSETLFGGGSTTAPAASPSFTSAQSSPKVAAASPFSLPRPSEVRFPRSWPGTKWARPSPSPAPSPTT